MNTAPSHVTSAYVLTDGLPAVEVACAETLAAGIASADVILNALARRLEPEPPPPILTPDRLVLSLMPRDTLRGQVSGAIHGAA